MDKHTHVPQKVNGLFWWHRPNQETQPVFVRESQPNTFTDVLGDVQMLADGEYLVGPQPAPSELPLTVRAQSSVKLSGSFVVDLDVKKGHCLVKGVNEALELARIPFAVMAFPR